MKIRFNTGIALKTFEQGINTENLLAALRAFADGERFNTDVASCLYPREIRYFYELEGLPPPKIPYVTFLDPFSEDRIGFDAMKSMIRAIVAKCIDPAFVVESEMIEGYRKSAERLLEELKEQEGLYVPGSAHDDPYPWETPDRVEIDSDGSVDI